MDVLARSGREVTVMAWNYHDDDARSGCRRACDSGRSPAEARRVQLRHHRIDQTHSNAYTV
jgi:xylan 1,4-beta-xylosidase